MPGFPGLLKKYLSKSLKRECEEKKLPNFLSLFFHSTFIYALNILKQIAKFLYFDYRVIFNTYNLEHDWLTIFFSIKIDFSLKKSHFVSSELSKLCLFTDEKIKPTKTISKYKTFWLFSITESKCIWQLVRNWLNLKLRISFDYFYFLGIP